jgi:hypothetical protein
VSDATERLGPALRSALAYTLLRASRLSQRTLSKQAQQPTDEPIRARATLESARIEETYRYFREISANATTEQQGEPTGQIELVLPYDGDTFFTQQAHQDVLRARRAGATGHHALVGFLSLNEYERFLPDLHDCHGSLPISMRLPADPTGDRLLADDSACVFRYGYQPSLPLAYDPVHLGVRIDDPDTAGFRWPRGTGQPPGQPPGQITGADTEIQQRNIMRNANFRSELELGMMVVVRLPRQIARDATATVREVFIGWPTRTSVSQLRLRVDRHPHDVRYNPERGGLEWSDVRLAADPAPASGELCTFRSPMMRLTIPQPADLYRQERLTGRVVVHVDRLLSGMSARLFDATGRLACPAEPEMASLITTEFALLLSDAFAARPFRPVQHLHFDEVVPSETRIDDIATALRNRGFEVYHRPTGSGPDSWWITAHRALGPDTLNLVILVLGQRHVTRRQRDVADGLRYETEVDSGELRMFVAGELPGDPAPIVRETNELRRALRERFDKLPVRQ